MVSSVKGASLSAAQSQNVPKKSAPGSGGGEAATRGEASFRTLLSGVAAQVQLSEEARTAGGQAARGSEVLNGLNDAISFSSRALDALNEIVDREEAAPDEVRQELDQLRNTMGETLARLRRNAVTREVMEENLVAAQVQLADLDAARQQAESTSIDIRAAGAKAVDAHAGLTPERVAELLAD
ncbi:MAG: hypothetical protein KDD44_01125 [Bdellovibrionales bacterium]|nr:hypothetical protein [Bdellovibrionales bacterium]